MKSHSHYPRRSVAPIIGVTLRMLPLGCMIVVFLALGLSKALAQSLAQKLPLADVSQIKTAASIPVTTESGKATVEFPAASVHDGKVLCLRFKAKLLTPTPAGWGPYTKIELNGKPVGAYMSDGSDRLLNRIGGMQTTDGKRNWWDNDEFLVTLFGPASGEMDSRLLAQKDEGYWYVLNISDVANYTKIGVDNRVESDGPNKLVLTNTYAIHKDGETSSCTEARFEDLSIGYLPQDELDKIQAAGIKPIPSIKGKILNGNGYTLAVAQSGAMELRMGNDRYIISSAYSYPGGSIGYHQFTWETASDTNWKTSSRSGKVKSEIIVKGESAQYIVTRTIVLADGKIHVSDKIANKTDAPLGMIVRYNISTPTPLKGGQSYLCGVKDSRSMEWCSANPTVFVNQHSSSAGFVCEDTLLRLQLVMTRRDNLVQFGTEHFGLAPKKSYTTEWTIYPSPNRDYFAFVNKVRKDWKVNFTVPGPFVFTDNHVAPGRTTKLYAIHPFFLYADGGHMDKDEFTKQVKPEVQSLLAAQPDAIPLGMIETNLVTLDRNKLQGAQITTERKYGLELDMPQTRIIEQNPLYAPWADSWPRTADGRAVVDTYYAYKPNLMNMMAYPVIGNHQYDFMKWQSDYLMDTVGCKGIYIDQFDIGYSIKGVGRPDYSKWDGHTVDLDARGQIIAKYTDATLVGSTARAALIKHIIGKGGIIVTNGHSCARETTGLPVCSFTETEWSCTDPKQLVETTEPADVGDCTAGHLSSPIGLGIRPTGIFAGNPYATEHFSEIIHKWVITCLKNGILYYYYMSNIPATGPGAGEYGVINYMFPFTPVELHSGWLVGKERTITAISGKYDWTHSEKPVCLVFDLKGRKLADPNVKMAKHGNAWQVDLKLSDWNETAVIMSASDLKTLRPISK